MDIHTANNTYFSLSRSIGHMKILRFTYSCGSNAVSKHTIDGQMEIEAAQTDYRHRLLDRLAIVGIGL
jgi:hypothetical protein